MTRAIRSEAALQEVLQRPGYRIREQETRSERVDTKPSTLTLHWPPSGQHAHYHRNNARILTREAIAYRAGVAALCARLAPITTSYKIHIHLSPPDARRRDADNAIKSVLDALVKAGYLVDDSMKWMKELHVTVDDERRGRVSVIVYPL